MRHDDEDDQDEEDNGGKDGDAEHAAVELLPDDPKFTPLGLTVSETFVLFYGLLAAVKARNREHQRGLVGTSIHFYCKDRHLLAAAVLIDLYMRDKIRLHHWTLDEGNKAPVAACTIRESKNMRHYLDNYLPEPKHFDVEIFHGQECG